MKCTAFLIAIITMVILLNNSIIYAQQENEQSHHLTNEHPSNKNHIAIFNGATTVFEHDITNYTVGIEYEHRFTKKIGLGFLAEYITEKADEFVIGIPFFIYPLKGIKLMAVPLLVYGEEPQEDQAHESEKEARYLNRIGVGYEFHFHNFSIDPILNFDFGKTEALGYGIAIGYGF